MKALSDLISTDYGLMSLIVIAVIFVVMAGLATFAVVASRKK